MPVSQHVTDVGDNHSPWGIRLQQSEHERELSKRGIRYDDIVPPKSDNNGRIITHHVVGG